MFTVSDTVLKTHYTMEIYAGSIFCHLTCKTSCSVSIVI